MKPVSTERERLRRVLIVEDDEAQRRTLGAILGAEGFDVIACADADAAFGHVERADFAAAVVDLRLPGLGGIEFLEKVSATNGGMRVIIHTAYGSFESAKDAVNLGAFAYVEKAGDPEVLVAEVHRAVRAHSEAYMSSLEETVDERTRRLHDANTRLELAAAEERVLGTLLRLSHRALDVEQFLGEALDTLLDGVPWLALQTRGAVFLHDEEREDRVLRLAVGQDLPDGVQLSCAEVPFGRCFCGNAAQTRNVQFAACVDERHETRYPDMQDHGHYVLPIESGDSLLGVLCLYVSVAHRREANEEAFLMRVANVLGLGIARRLDEERIAHLAYYDPLTDLPNRRLLLNRLHKELAVAGRRGLHGALLFLDLDRFKTLNDALGHAAGDAVLKEVALRLLRLLRAEDTVARLGGDEFVVLLPKLGTESAGGAEQALIVAEKLRSALAVPYRIEDRDYDITASIGIALFPGSGADADAILQRSDAAMYRAKEVGRDTVCFFEPEMQGQADARLALERDLRTGLKEDQMCLYLQPQVDADIRVRGAEALVRWRHPTDGIVRPTAFLTAAEETGMILDLDCFAIQTACRQLAAWAALPGGGPANSLSVNVSARHFHQADFVESVRRILTTSGADPTQLVLEITERNVITDTEGATERMRALRAIGVRFAIDDFGTGFSSLSHLRRLPLDQLKIDRSFVTDLEDNPTQTAIVESIIGLARALGIEVVAEGVESESQFRILAKLGCDLFQGHYFGAPRPAEAFGSLASAVAE